MTLNGQALKGNVPENIPIKIIANLKFVHSRLSEMSLMTEKNRSVVCDDGIVKFKVHGVTDHKQGSRNQDRDTLVPNCDYLTSGVERRRPTSMEHFKIGEVIRS